MSLSLSHWYPGSGKYLIVSIPDLCTLTYFPYYKLANIYTNCSGHMTKVADIPIYGKTTLKISSQEPEGR